MWTGGFRVIFKGKSYKELLRERAGLRAVGYEERIKRGEGGIIVRRF